jgi:hypothetical protein
MIRVATRLAAGMRSMNLGISIKRRNIAVDLLQERQGAGMHLKIASVGAPSYS